MAIVQRNTKGKAHYQVKVRDLSGQWFPCPTFERRVDAEAYERQLLFSRDDGARARPQSTRELTLKEYWDQWTIGCRDRVSLGWKISQDQMAKDYILPVLGNRRLVELRSQDIAQVLRTAAQQGRAPQTRLHVFSLMHKLFEDAVEHFEYLDRNPVIKKHRPQVPLRERAFLTPGESRTLLAASRDHYLGPPIWMQILAGLRPCESIAIPWSHVDFDLNHLLIRMTYNQKEKRIQDQPKQGDWGKAPMTPDLRDYLLSRKGLPGEFVAQSPHGGRLSYNTYLPSLKRFCEQVGVKVVTPHELRHSASELYTREGATQEDIRRLLNHTSLTATARYMHRTNDRLMQIASRVRVEG